MIEALCIGHAAWDISVWVREFPAENSKSQTETLLECSGGPAANAACLLAHWGIRTGFIGALGEDEAGTRIIRSLRGFGVETRGVSRLAGWPSPLSVILVNESNGSRTIVNRSRPATEHPPLTVEAFADSSPRLLLFDGHELEASLEAMHRWPDAITVLDAGSLREGTQVLGSRVSHLVASERFARQFTGLGPFTSPDEWARAIGALHDLNGHPVVITLGEHGFIFGERNAWRHLPAQPATPVDTTGAGDIIHGALAYELLRARAPQLSSELLQKASVAAALSVEKRGSSASIPPLSDYYKELDHPL